MSRDHNSRDRKAMPKAVDPTSPSTAILATMPLVVNELLLSEMQMVRQQVTSPVEAKSRVH